MSEELIQVEVARITADDDIQVRTCMDDATVANYYERLLAGGVPPPIDVYDDGKTLWLSDGFHRLAAAKRAIRRTINARVFKGTRADAGWAAIRANRDNGLQLNAGDRVRCVKRALLMRPHESNRMIAEYVGVSHHTVQKYRGELESGGQIAHLTTTTGADGKQYPARRPVDNDPSPPPPSIAVGTDDPPPPAYEPPPVMDEPPPAIEPPPTINDQPPPAIEPPPTNASAPTANVVRDRTGLIVTDAGLIEVFKRDREIVELCTAVSRVKSAVLTACRQEDPLFAHINTGAFEAEATNVYRQIAHTRPHAVCPYCNNGSGRRACNACKGLGWVNEAIYTHAPAEKKQRRF